MVKVKDVLKLYEEDGSVVFQLGDYSVKFAPDAEMNIKLIASVIRMLGEKVEDRDWI